MTNLTITDKMSGESVRDYAYRILIDHILNLKLLPGTSMSEMEISQLLGISRTPIREAFIRLAQEGLLDILPQRGTYVAKIDLAQVAESRFLRETMEQAVMHIACAAFPKEGLERLNYCLDLQEACIGTEDYPKFFELDSAMHGIIFESCQKGRIWRMIQTMNLNYFRVRAMNLYKGYYEMPLLFYQHQQIVEAITTKDVDLGQKMISLHINKVVMDIEELKKSYTGYFR